jgi:hypothetical protein
MEEVPGNRVTILKAKANLVMDQTLTLTLTEVTLLTMVKSVAFVVSLITLLTHAALNMAFPLISNLKASNIHTLLILVALLITLALLVMLL